MNCACTLLWLCVCSLRYHHELHMHHVVICGLPAVQYFPHYLINGTILEIKLLSKMFLIFSTDFAQNISHSNKKWARCDKMYIGLTWRTFSKSDYNETWIFLPGVKNTQILNFMKIHPVGTDLLSDERGTDMTKIILAFRKFGNAPNNSHNSSAIHILCSCNPLVCAADSSCFFTVSWLWYWVADWYKCCDWMGFVYKRNCKDLGLLWCRHRLGS